MDDREVADFRELVWEFYREHARDMPWRNDPTPYQVFISEIMLQQTQVARVHHKYAEWMATFPNFHELAESSTAQVLATWQGLGYNRRALWTHRAAQAIVATYGGELPRDPAELMKLPGIGPNTAGSLAAFAYNSPVVFIETNIRRVFIHHFFPGAENARIAENGEGNKANLVSDAQLLPLIAAALDREHPRDWYYALMDYGAYLAKQIPNPNRRSRHYAVQSKFEGSVRQLRGEVLRRLTVGPTTAEKLGISDDRLSKVLQALASEGFLEERDGSWHLHA